MKLDLTTEGLRKRITALAAILGYESLTLDAGGSTVDAKVVMRRVGTHLTVSGETIDTALFNLATELMRQARDKVSTLHKAMGVEE